MEPTCEGCGGFAAMMWIHEDRRASVCEICWRQRMDGAIYDEWRGRQRKT